MMPNKHQRHNLPQCIFVMPTKSSFMNIDHDILKMYYTVIPVYLSQGKNRIAYMFSLIRLIFNLLIHPKVKTSFVWFADYHAFIVVLINNIFKRKTIVFIGGYDAVLYPELKMGVHYKPLRSFCNKYCLKHADLIISNHAALIKSQNFYYTSSGHEDGILSFIPNLKTPTRVLYNGIKMQNDPALEPLRAQRILTIGLTPRIEDFINKGYDLLIEIAKRRPELNFTFIGIPECWLVELDRNYQFSQLPNIDIFSWVDHDKLNELYLSSAVYVQASISEGMPNSLIEAMYYGCIPVGSNVAGIPTVIDTYGKIVYHRNSIELELAIDVALKLNNRQAVHDYIANSFSIEIRQNNLATILREFDLIK